jgi:hypothetical protein
MPLLSILSSTRTCLDLIVLCLQEVPSAVSAEVAPSSNTKLDALQRDADPKLLVSSKGHVFRVSMLSAKAPSTKKRGQPFLNFSEKMSQIF